MKKKVLSVALAALITAACGSSTPTPASSNASGSAGASGTSGVSAGGAAEASGSVGGPAMDVSCASDADCVNFSEDIDGPHKCCSGCTNHISNRTWHNQFESACKASPPKECPPLGCAMAIVHPACVANKCIDKK